MSREKSKKQERGRSQMPRYILAFPVIVLVIYGVLFLFVPERALDALRSSGKVLMSILLPISLVFVVMLVLNLFIKPARVARFLGSGTSIKGILLPALAGIISAGPIYVWYPLLKELREKGAGDMPIAVFLYNRSVKPFLLPVMIAYFGWVYAVVLTVFTLIASAANGYLVSVFTGKKTGERRAP